MKTKLLIQKNGDDIKILDEDEDYIYFVQSGDIISIDKTSIKELIKLLKKLK